MRTTFVAVSLSLMLLTSTAFAQSALPESTTTSATLSITSSSMATSVANDVSNVTKTLPASNMMTPAPKPLEPAAHPDSYLVKDAPLPSDFVMGKKTAPLIMIEYASLSCPHCAHFSVTTLPELIKNYVDTGKMRYILRQFPLNEPALKGAMLLDCVGEEDQAKYYLFAKVLFDAQSKWAFNNDWMSGLETIATVGGVSKDQFEKCINNTERETKVLKIKKLANDELHVPHTPYIIIGGEAYDGDRGFEAMSKFIDAKLAEGRGKN